MKLRFTLVAAVCSLCLLAANSSRAVTLASLASNPSNSLVSGPLTFDNFVVFASGIGTFDPANVIINPFSIGTQYGLTIGSSFQTIRSGPYNQPPRILNFSYDVTAANGVYVNHAYMSAVATGALFGNISPGDIASSNVTKNITPAGVTLSVFGDSSGGPVQSHDAAPIVPNLSSFNVNEVISEFVFLSNTGESSNAHISGLTNTYDVPEPGNLAMLFGLGVSGTLFGLKLRRRSLV